MRKLLTTFVCVWFTLAVWAGDGIYEKLQQIPQISEIQKLDVKPFQEYYQFWFEQPVDYTGYQAENLSGIEMDQYRNQQRRTDDDISPLFLPGRCGYQCTVCGSPESGVCRSPFG